MKNLKILFVLLISSFFLFAFSYMNDKEELRIPWKNGILNGALMIHIQDSLSRVDGYTLQGRYKNNQKEGTWKLWDKNHKLIVERVYQNNFEYVVRNSNLRTTLNRDVNGQLIFPKIEEKDVAVSQRVWKMVTSNQMRNNKALAIAIQQIDLSEFTAYRSDELRDTINIHKSMRAIHALKIMGDWFFDSKKNISSFYILAISPIYRKQSNGAWYYYPEIRRKMALIKIEDKNAMIHNLDDLFFLGSYPSITYKTESIENKAFKKKDYEQETINTLLYQFTIESTLWK